MDYRTSGQTRIFVSYSHRDLYWLQRLQVHLRPLGRSFDIDIWDDTRLLAGSKWREEIRKAVTNANAAILIISADFLASEFIQTQELPHLLLAAKDRNALIIPIIVSPSLFHRESELGEFQAINSPELPLISMPPGDQERVFVQVAEALMDRAHSMAGSAADNLVTSSGESFVSKDGWVNLVKIGNWIFDKDSGRIMGSGMHSFLLSAQEYGQRPYKISAALKFSNFARPDPQQLGMNAGLILGWDTASGVQSYYNILLTGDALLLERITSPLPATASGFQHLSVPVPFTVEPNTSHEFTVSVGLAEISLFADGRELLRAPKPDGIYGRVGLRPWRSNVECTRFEVAGA